MSRKRQLHEVLDLDGLQEPIANASVEGLITSVSPIKKGKTSNYFDGTVADSTAKVRLVGFTASQQKKVNEYMTQNQPIKIENCEVKRAQRGNKMEVMLKGNTKIGDSPKKFAVSSLQYKDDTPTTITLSNLETTNVYERVTVNVKVQTITTPISVPGGKKKQEIYVADSTGVGKVTLWEKDIGQLQESVCYSLKGFMVKEYASSKFLSMSKNGSEVGQIPDIGQVKDVTADNIEENTQLFEAQVIGVVHLQNYKVCLRCKARVEPATPPLGRCSKPECAMLQRYDICLQQLSAKLLLLPETGNGVQSLSVFGDLVRNIANIDDSEEVTEEALLNSPKLSVVTYNDKNTIISFSR